MLFKNRSTCRCYWCTPLRNIMLIIARDMEAPMSVNPEYAISANYDTRSYCRWTASMKSPVLPKQALQNKCTTLVCYSVSMHIRGTVVSTYAATASHQKYSCSILKYQHSQCKSHYTLANIHHI